MEKGNKQRITVGSIFMVELDNGYHTYGRIVSTSSYAFYDCRVNSDISDLREIVSSPVLFITSVYNEAITSGHWKKIGHLPLETFLQKLPPRFIQDPIHPDQFSIKDYQTNKTISATKEDCIGMERASVWEARAIEERLNDFYSGKYQFNSNYFDRPELFQKVAVSA